jgi:hypothetical protein
LKDRRKIERKEMIKEWGEEINLERSRNEEKEIKYKKQ